MYEYTLSPKIKELCDEIFLNEIKSTMDLLKVINKLFYPSNNMEDKSFEPVICQKINIFLEKFVVNLINTMK